MILRKPYAFLIKHFKLFHLIITVFMALSLYKLFGVISFFGEYVINESNIVGQQLTDVVYPSIVLISPIVVIVFSLILLGVMAVKKKPFKLYIVNIIVYILYLVMIIIGRSNVDALSKALVDIRIIKMIRDLTTMLLIIQIYPLSKNFVRAIGFDIKQFDFKKDLAELEINEEDNEEVEVAFSFDFNKLKRMLNNGIRNFKYYYLEHKFIVSVGGLVAIVLIAGSIALGIYSTNNTLNYNQSLYVNGLYIKVLNTYVTRLDYNGNEINNLGKNNTLVVIPIAIKNNSSKDKEFVSTNIELKIGNDKYRHISIYRDSIFDLGYTYQGAAITKESTEHVNLVYEVPTKYIASGKQMTLKVITSIDESKKKLIPTYSNLKVNYNNIDENISTYDINENEEIVLTDSILGKTNLTIKSIEVNKQFKINYTYCLNSKKCIDSYEYLNPPLNSNKDKALMRINGTVTYDEDYKLNDLNNLFDLFENFGIIKYTKDNVEKTIKDIYRVNPLATKSENIIYLSVPEDILESDNIELYLNIRNKQYKYIIK